MEDYEILGKIRRVTAPPDFEMRVLARLAERKAARKTASPFRIRFLVATVPAALLAVALMINVFVLRHPADRTDLTAQKPAGRFSEGTGRNAGVIAIMEPMNYRQEVRRLSDEPGDIYILENVSDEIYQEIRY